MQIFIFVLQTYGTLKWELFAGI